MCISPRNAKIMAATINAGINSIENLMILKCRNHHPPGQHIGVAGVATDQLVVMRGSHWHNAKQERWSMNGHVALARFITVTTMLFCASVVWPGGYDLIIEKRQGTVTATRGEHGGASWKSLSFECSELECQIGIDQSGIGVGHAEDGYGVLIDFSREANTLRFTCKAPNCKFETKEKGRSETISNGEKRTVVPPVKMSLFTVAH